MRKRVFGRRNGREVEQVVLQSADAAASILSYGCVVRDWRVDGPDGSLPMVLGFPRLEDYEKFAHAHGAVVGRIANRTANASFELDGQTYHLTKNHGAHHIHGCLGRVIWEMEGDAAAEAVRLRYHSPDGEDGCPGNVDFAVSYRLEGPRLTCEMSGLPDRRTPISLAHHAYYNAGGGGTVKDHVLWVDAGEYTPLGPDQIPLGTIEPVEGTDLDFREPREIGGTAIDNNLVLNPDRDRTNPSASARCPRTGLAVRVWTDEPGMQVFDAAAMTIGTPGHDGQRYGPFAGLCLEAQHFPDSLHNPEWPSIIRSPEDPYFQRYVVEIARGAR